MALSTKGDLGLGELPAQEVGDIGVHAMRIYMSIGPKTHKRAYVRRNPSWLGTNADDVWRWCTWRDNEASVFIL